MFKFVVAKLKISLQVKCNLSKFCVLIRDVFNFNPSLLPTHSYFKIHFSIVLLSTLVFVKWLHPLRFSDQYFISISYFIHSYYMPRL